MRVDTKIPRYTLTYIPSLDCVLPSPSHLHVKVKNTCAIALRAAYLHGPYTLYAACYPSTFNPHDEDIGSRTQGIPDFEPNLKAGGTWLSKLTVPENIRETADKANVKRTIDGRTPSCTWIIEVSSQVIFSTSASVHFEVLVARDERSIESGVPANMAYPSVAPGQLQDHQLKAKGKTDISGAHAHGVYSEAVELVAEDTESLWNKPNLPEWNDEGKDRGHTTPASDEGTPITTQCDKRESSSASLAGKRRKKIHLVVLTHGLHSNLGSDMLYIKESIDATAKQARLDAQKRKRNRISAHRPEDTYRGHGPLEDAQAGQGGTSPTAPLSGGQNELDSEDEDEDEEHVIVRGFSGNAVRTERGIQYLGKRLAKYVLTMTYPDQSYLPPKKSNSKARTKTFVAQEPVEAQAGLPTLTNGQVGQAFPKASKPAYKITSISFIAHSLGGLTQTYAIAYIQKHSPHFFEIIRPINFVSMATPFLGLSNENPIYVKFALDFGLVGRTGQDLGLAWRAPAMVRSGWSAMIGGIGNEGQRALKQPNPGSKPLLRILPTGPAQQVLKLFRNRTVYSNVVNDGIVPLRTSCLLFLDWRGLGRVEKARRENGIVGTMAGWGWAELTGAKSSFHRQTREKYADEYHERLEKGDEVKARTIQNQSEQGEVPQPSEAAVQDEAGIGGDAGPEVQQPSDTHLEESHDADIEVTQAKSASSTQATNAFGSLLNFLRPSQPKAKPRSPKQNKIYSRSQTLQPDSTDASSYSSGNVSEADPLPTTSQSQIVKGESAANDPNTPFDPPRTSIFESAGDILNPPLPSKEFILNPASRPRTIFHDRIYHPEDIPPPRIKRRTALKRSFSSESRKLSSRSSINSSDFQDGSNSGMKVEEKIARAYHRDLSWRKVLVRLEPDAHNNICVRRMFSNAYGWPVVKHLVDTHFADSWTAATADSKESNQERAKPMEEGVGLHGEEVQMPSEPRFTRTDSEVREAKDHVPGLTLVENNSMSRTTGRPWLTHQDSAQWDDRFLDETDDDSEFGDVGFRRSLEIPASRLTADGGSEEHKPSANRTDSPKPPSKNENRDSSTDDVQEQPDAGDPIAKSDRIDHEGEERIVIRGGTTSLGLGTSVEEQLGKIAGIAKHAVGEQNDKEAGNGSVGQSKDLG